MTHADKTVNTTTSRGLRRAGDRRIICVAPDKAKHSVDHAESASGVRVRMSKAKA